MLFGSNHKPYHLLCRSHAVEKLDGCNLSCTDRRICETKETLENICPKLKSFFRGKKTTVEAGINANLTLVSHDKSGKTCNLASLFDRICERGGVTKRISMYIERRFAKLGKAAAAIVEAYPLLRLKLEETTTSNQLIACKIYIESELFYTELKTLEYFNYHITFPFLHAMEKCSQTELCTLLPQLYHDLLRKKIDTLKEYVVSIRRVKVEAPKSEVGSEIIDLMCLEAASGILLQCRREYGFPEDLEDVPRDTDISQLTAGEREKLPTNNLQTERNLSIFDK